MRRTLPLCGVLLLITCSLREEDIGGISRNTDTAEQGGDDSAGDSASSDVDDDGYTTLIDCDDSDPLVHPSADEECDGRDNDCDDEIDEGCDTGGE